MRTRSKLTLAGLAAAMLMAMAVGNTSANSLSISHANLFRIEWSSLELGIGGLAGVRCAMTLEGSFHSTTVPKIETLLIGHVTHASIKIPCILGTATILQSTLPWHITYRGFQGELPTITALRVLLTGASFRYRNALTTGCLLVTTATEPAVGVIEEFSETGGGNRVYNRLQPDAASKIRCTGVEGGASFNGGEFRSRGILREVPGGAQNILVRLI